MERENSWVLEICWWKFPGKLICFGYRVRGCQTSWYALWSQVAITRKTNDTSGYAKPRSWNSIETHVQYLKVIVKFWNLLLIITSFYSIKHSWHGFCLYTGGACKSLEFLRQSACKICDWRYVKTEWVITPYNYRRSHFYRKTCNLFRKSKCGTSRAVPVCWKTSWSMSDFVVLLLGFASTFYNIRWFRACSFLLPGNQGM